MSRIAYGYRFISKASFLFAFFVVMNSCGMRKKNYKLVSPAAKDVNSGNPAVPSDANSARNFVWTHSMTKNYANLLEVDEYTIHRSQHLYHFIDEWIGSPHKLGGTLKNGIDCSGFIQILYAQIYQKTLPRSSRDMAKIVKRKYDSQLKEGDLVFFSFGRNKIDHVGVYLHNNKFVHVSTKKGVIISDLKDPWYAKYIARLGTPKV